MSDVGPLRQIVAESRSKQLKREVKERLAPLVQSLVREESQAEAISEELSQLHWTDCVELLAPAWPNIPTVARNLYIRALWDRKDEPKMASSARLALAAAIQQTDETSAAALLDLVFNVMRKKVDTLRSAFSRSWLRAARAGDVPPFASLRWEAMGPTWRFELVDALVTAAKESATNGTEKRGSLSDVRPQLIEWVERLASSTGDGDTGRLRAMLARLSDRPPAPVPKPEHSGTPDTGSMATTSPATPPAAPPPTPPKPIDPASSASPSDPPASKAAQPRAEVRTAERGGDRSLRTAARRLAELSHSLGALVEEEAAAAEKRLAQASAKLKEAELDRQQLQEALAAANGELGKLRGTIASLNQSLDRTGEERDAAQRRVAALETQLATSEARLEAAEARSGELSNRLEGERDHVVKERDLARREARRVMGEQIAATLAEELATFSEIEKTPPSGDGEAFLRRVVNEMIARLETQGVPLRR